MLEKHQLVTANTWSVRKPATHAPGNSLSQVDFVLLRSSVTRSWEELLSRQEV